jgi:hypothetical protein
VPRRCTRKAVKVGRTHRDDGVTNETGTAKPDGVHAHIAMKTDDGLRVIEVWDSTDAIDRYMASGLGEAMENADVPQPTITDFEVHRFDWAG